MARAASSTSTRVPPRFGGRCGVASGETPDGGRPGRGIGGAGGAIGGGAGGYACVIPGGTGTTVGTMGAEYAGGRIGGGAGIG